jgi:hypothetical protein
MKAFFWLFFLLALLLLKVGCLCDDHTLLIIAGVMLGESLMAAMGPSDNRAALSSKDASIAVEGRGEQFRASFVDLRFGRLFCFLGIRKTRTGKGNA